MSGPLTTAALLGSARSSGLPDPSHELLEIPWSALRELDPSRAILHAAALEAAAIRAGRQAITGLTPPAPSAPESKPVAPAAAAQAVQRMLAGEFPQGLPEWLAAAERAGMVASARLLPYLFDFGSRDRKLRPAIRKIAGHRGLWLAAREQRWAWVIEETAVSDEAWETGSSADRLAWLRQIRVAEPARAIAAISADWQNESPDLREAIAQLASEAPLPEDEPWLESLALTDRRQSTRQPAARALMKLPGSAFRRRALARAASLLSVQGRLRKTLTLQPPETFDPEWAVDGLKEKPPKGSGQKGWWARQLLAQVPLATWTGQLGLALVDLFKMKLDPDWQEAIVLGWLDAAEAHPDPDPLRDFLPLLLSLEGKLPALKNVAANLANLLKPLAPAERATILENLAARNELLVDLVVRFQPPLDTGQHPRLSKLVTAWWIDKKHDLTRPEAVALAFCADPNSIPALLKKLAALPELSSAMEEYARALEFRQTYLPHLNPR